MSSRLENLKELDKKYHIHPFTDHVAMHEKGTHLIERGEGCYLWDGQGNKLLDGLAGLWCTNIGYGNSEMSEAIKNQLDTLAYYCSFFNSTTEPAIRLSEKIASLAPKNVNRTIFCNSGSEANETAMKLIRSYQKIRNKENKYKIISRTFSYHGVGMASASLTGLETCTKPFNLPFDGFLRAPGPYAYAAGKENDKEAYGQWCIEETRKLIEKEGADTIAAMFVEPVQGAGGVIPPPKNYIKALRELCKENDILFVADEVITGFGRLGGWFASTDWGLEPDMICFAKGVTSGYLPLGGTMISDEVSETLLSGGYLAHGFTYSGHPVSCAAALKNIEIIEKLNLCEYVKEDIGPYFQKELSKLSTHKAVGEIRGEGLMAAIELIPKEGRETLTPDHKLGIKAADMGRDEGIIVRGIGNLIAVAPPLIITRKEVDELVGSIKKVLDQLW